MRFFYLLPRRLLVAAATARHRQSVHLRRGQYQERTRAQGSRRARRMDTRRHGNACFRQTIIYLAKADKNNIVS